MIKARHTFVGKMVAWLYSGPMLVRAFHKIEYQGEEWVENGLPTLMLSNHFSWWDGFIQYRLSRKIFGRKLHVMMLEEQLRKNMILNQCGCFSVKKNSRTIIQTLNYCKEILNEPSNMLLIFPQGQIQSMHTDRVKFEAGLGYLLKHIDGEVNIVFNVNLVDYFSDKTPGLSIYFKAFTSNQFDHIQTIERQYNQFYTWCKNNQNRKI